MPLQIQPRDRDIFRFIYENLYVTASQIHKAIFKDKSLVTAKVRLGQLYHARWLEKIRAERILFKLNHRSLNEIRGILVEMDRYQNRRLRRYQVMHDLKAIDCKIDLNQSPWILKFYPQINIQSFQYSENDYRRKTVMKVPDAIFDLQLGKRTLKCAFELEITQKEDRRYKRILEQYYSRIPVDLVFYVVHCHGLKKKLLELGKEAWKGAQRYSDEDINNKLWVANYDDFMKYKLNTEFESPFGKKFTLKGLEEKYPTPNSSGQPIAQSEVGGEVGVDELLEM